MTPKQEAFARAYIETGNAAEAYRRAYPAARRWKEGVAKVKGAELLKHPEVAAKVLELRGALDAEALENAEGIRRFWTLVMRDEREDIRVRLRASELLARSLGMFIERRGVELNPPCEIVDVMVVPFAADEEADR